MQDNEHSHRNYRRKKPNSVRRVYKGRIAVFFCLLCFGSAALIFFTAEKKQYLILEFPAFYFVADKEAYSDYAQAQANAKGRAIETAVPKAKKVRSLGAEKNLLAANYAASAADVFTALNYACGEFEKYALSYELLLLSINKQIQKTAAAAETMRAKVGAAFNALWKFYAKLSDALTENKSVLAPAQSARNDIAASMRLLLYNTAKDLIFLN